MRNLLLAGLFLAAPAFAAAQTTPAEDTAAAPLVAACGDVSPEDDEAAIAAKLACFTAEAAKAANAELPRKVDEVLTLERVSAEGTRITYHYTLAILAADIPAGALDTMKASVVDSVCKAEPMRAAMAAGGSYRYLWADQAGAPVSELVMTACES